MRKSISPDFTEENWRTLDLRYSAWAKVAEELGGGAIPSDILISYNFLIYSYYLNFT